MSDHDPFSYLTGYPVQPTGVEQMKTHCPFCKKEEHFYFSTQTHLWDCKVCGKTGNLLTFVREFYELAEHRNKTETGHTLSKIRDLPDYVFQRQGVVFSPFTQNYLFPTWKDGKIGGMYKVITQHKEGKAKLRCYCLPTLGHTICDWEIKHDTVWVLEGQWDKLAADAIIGTRNITSLGVPGASVFKDAWLELLSGKDIVLFFHPDDAGRAAMTRLVEKHIANSQFKPKSISYCSWHSTENGKETPDPEGYDLNKLWIDYKRTAYTEVEKRIKGYDIQEGISVVQMPLEATVSDRTCITYDNLINRMGTAYYVTPDMKGALLFMMASVYSVKVEGEQLWGRVMGPPACGKTTCATLISTHEQVVLRSTFTGLFSGYRDENDDTDAGMIPTISGKTLCVKDADALLQQPNYKQILSELRDFYDKNSSVQFRNKKFYDYRDVKSTFLLCGTRFLRYGDDTMLGERFLDYEMTVTPQDETTIQHMMYRQSLREATNPDHVTDKKLLYSSAKGFMENMFSQSLNVHMTLAEEEHRIISWAWLTAKLRTRVERGMNGTGEIKIEPISEMANRLIGQFVKYALCSSHILGIPSPDSYVWKELAKIVLSILDPTSLRFKIVELLMEKNVSAQDVQSTFHLTEALTVRHIQDLHALKVLDVGQKAVSGTRAVRTFSLIPPIQQALMEVLNA